MTDRDELAASIAYALDKHFGIRDFGPAAQDFAVADALLADGWRKPNQPCPPNHCESLSKNTDSR